MADKNEFFIRAAYIINGEREDREGERGWISQAFLSMAEHARNNDCSAVEIWRMNADGKTGRLIAYYANPEIPHGYYGKGYWDFEPGW